MQKICLLSFLFLLSINLAKAQQNKIRFKHLSSLDGLSQDRVTSMIQDSRGFLWFGTEDGLNKYDGNKFTIYRSNPSDPHSLTSSYVTNIIEDKNGNIWVGCHYGLNVYNRKTNKFKRFLKDDNPKSISGDIINSIYQDKQDNIWICTWEGLNLFNPEDSTFTHFIPQENDPKSINHKGVMSFHEDKQGNLWVGTFKGLDLFDRTSKTFTHYFHNENDPTSIANYSIIDLLEDKKGNLWIFTEGGGLSYFDTKTRKAKNYLNDKNNPNSLSNNSLRNGLLDPAGNLWIITLDGGLNYLNTTTGKFTIYNTIDNAKDGLKDKVIYSILQDKGGNIWLGLGSNGLNYFHPDFNAIQTYRKSTTSDGVGGEIIRAILEDSKGNIWIGTEDNGLDKWDRKTNAFTHYTSNPKDPNGLNDDLITNLIEDKEGNIWMSTWGGGINKLDPHTNTFTHYLHNPKDKNSIGCNKTWALLFDKEGKLWIGTHSQGLSVYDPKMKTFKHYLYTSDAHSINHNWIYALHEDKEGNMWVGTAAGLSLYDPKVDGFHNFNPVLNTQENTAEEKVNFITEDSRNNLWIGTRSGLSLFDRVTKKAVVYRVKDGLPNEIIQSLVEDNEGNLWLATKRGISKFNPITKKFRNYSLEDGLQGNEFSENARLKLKSGEIIFGGTHGFNIFNPKKIKDNTHLPEVYLTNFEIFNKPVIINGPDSPLKSPITETEKITLSYKESIFSFEFAALNYYLSEKNQYAYKMDGFDKDWNYVGNSRKATYTNLDAGSYTFRVKASNNDGYWSDKTCSVKIIITPPFWKTWWFKGLLLVTIMGSAVGWYKYRINAIRKRQELLERQVDERTAEVVQQKEELATQAENLQKAHEQLEEVFKDVKDSIRAAESIQKSILPSENQIGRHFQDTFILYKPKDVVSGDFYWFDTIEDQIVVAAVDCTGHGVSGAFMSINGHHLLNQAIYPYGNNLLASEILDRLNESVIKGLNGAEADKGKTTYDGMDIALCVIDKKRMKLQFAGANNPLYILRGEEIIQVKANKFAIGLSITREIKKFTNKEIDIQAGDILYVFSDGYADQIGGADSGEKLMYPKLRETLLEHKNQGLKEQMQVLDDTFNNWKGSFEQLDDVLVIGIKV